LTQETEASFDFRGGAVEEGEGSLEVSKVWGGESRVGIGGFREGEDFCFGFVHEDAFARAIRLDGMEDKGEVAVREERVRVIKIGLES
jgi:hypothetical protein